MIYIIHNSQFRRVFQLCVTPLMASSLAVRTVQHHFPPLPGLRDFIYMYRLNADKTLSQNYLMDMNLTRKMVRKAGDMTDAFVLEVGPGPGGITRAILEQPFRRLDVLEIDKQFLMPLQHLSNHSGDRMHIHKNDILKTDVEKIWTDAGAPKCSWNEERPPFHIIGNLPFHISTPLLIKYFKEMSIRRGPFAFGRVPLTFTFQTEVANRVIGRMDTEFRSRIGVTSQNWTEPRIMFQVPGRCFTPRPDINVCVVQFMPRMEPQIPAAYAVSEKVIRVLFHFKRRFMLKAAKLLYPKEVALQMADQLLKRCGIDNETTMPRLSMEEIAAIVVNYEKQCRELPGLFLYDFRHPRTLEMLAQEPEEDLFPPPYKKQSTALEQIDDDGMTLDEFCDIFGTEQRSSSSRWSTNNSNKYKQQQMEME